jgi:hypothetical protein
VKEFFVTKYGQSIKIIPGYLNAHNKFNVSRVCEFNKECLNSEQSMNYFFTDFFHDLFEYSIVMDFLDSIDHSIECKSALDIGGQQGYISRFLMAEGKVMEADVIERFDYSKKSSVDIINWCFKRYSWWKLSQKFHLDTKISKAKKLNNAYLHYCKIYGYLPDKHTSKFWNIKFLNKPTISNYIVDDFYKHEKKYDFISSFLSIPWFDYKKFFKKISDLLNENGTFVFMTDYWWWPVTSTKIVGHFPYVSQRLDRDDFKRYLEEFHPDEVDDNLKRYDWFHQSTENKATLSQYIEEAEKNGLSLLNYKRIMPRESTNNKTSVSPFELENYDDTNLLEVLDNISQFRNDVTIEDLKTDRIMVAFVKKPKNQNSIDNYFKKLDTEGYKFYMKSN